jgi:hypothetical protein
MHIMLDFTGGCVGGHDKDAFCYCDAVDVHAKFYCTNNACGAYSKPGKLGDKGSLERFLMNHCGEALTKAASESIEMPSKIKRLFVPRPMVHPHVTPKLVRGAPGSAEKE